MGQAYDGVFGRLLMEKKKVTKYLKELDESFWEAGHQFYNVNELITEFRRFSKIHGNTIFIRVKGDDDCWWTPELVVHRKETDEELKERQEQAEAALNVHKDMRRQEYEKMKREFEGDEGAGVQCIREDDV